MAIMTTLKACRRCPGFQGISYVHPQSIAHERDKIPHGWYVTCGAGAYDSDRYKIHGAIGDGDNDLPCESYQVLLQFLRLNASRLVECPRHERGSQRRENMVSGQLALF